jgi:nucleoside-diphosphate-sugar epimerase
MSKLIVGCGYLGIRVARRWAAEGRTVFAMTRSVRRAEEFRRVGLRPIVADVGRPETLTGLPEVETVLYSLGYDRRGAASRQSVCVGGLGAVLDALPVETGKIIYVSSTGVYGPSGGPWVDEDSPCRPAREAGRVMLAAEEVLCRHPLGARAIVLRLAGLYGPGRIPHLADLQAGRPIEVVARGCINLIHVEDAARAVLAAEVRGRPPRTYIVSDGHPADRRDFYVRLAELMSLAPPRFVEIAPAEAALRRGSGDKRVSNARMLAELGVSLEYPSYREGLAAV